MLVYVGHDGTKTRLSIEFVFLRALLLERGTVLYTNESCVQVLRSYFNVQNIKIAIILESTNFVRLRFQQFMK